METIEELFWLDFREDAVPNGTSDEQLRVIEYAFKTGMTVGSKIGRKTERPINPLRPVGTGEATTQH